MLTDRTSSPVSKCQCMIIPTISISVLLFLMEIMAVGLLITLAVFSDILKEAGEQKPMTKI